MGLLKSVDDVPGIDYYEFRDSLYYNKYEYRLRIEVPCLHYVWWCKKPEDLDKKLDPDYKGKGGYGKIKDADVSTVAENIDALKALITIQNNRTKPKNLGMRVEGNVVAFFSTSLQELHQLQQTIGSIYPSNYTQVKTSQFAGIKHFVNEPKHKYRIYLKSKRVESPFPQELHDLLERSPGLHASPALSSWTNNAISPTSHMHSWRFRWSSSSHFIDYDDESTLSYLALMHGDFLGKRYKLEKRS